MENILTDVAKTCKDIVDSRARHECSTRVYKVLLTEHQRATITSKHAMPITDMQMRRAMDRATGQCSWMDKGAVGRVFLHECEVQRAENFRKLQAREDWRE